MKIIKKQDGTWVLVLFFYSIGNCSAISYRALSEGCLQIGKEDALTCPIWREKSEQVPLMSEGLGELMWTCPLFYNSCKGKEEKGEQNV